MNTPDQPTSRFLSLRKAAAHLGLPESWLQREADAGRVPCLRVGRRRLFNPKAVARALASRASTPEKPEAAR